MAGETTFEGYMRRGREEVFSFFSYFEKNSSYVICGVSVCIFVALSVRMCVAGGNQVKGTMLGTNEILASKHDIAALKVKQGHFETAILVLHNLSSFITAKGV